MPVRLPTEPTTQPMNLCGKVSEISHESCLTAITMHEFAHVLGFDHESARPDRTSCPNNNPGTPWPPPNDLNTLITKYDADSITDRNYCKAGSQAFFSTEDIRGAVAIYGAGNIGCAAGGPPCSFVRYPASGLDPQYAFRVQRPAPALRDANGRYLKPQEGIAAVTVQHFVGDWERVRIRRVRGAVDDGYLRYYDVINIQDRWGRYLSARQNGTVEMVSARASYEEWEVEATHSNYLFGDSRVLVNAPLRLRSVKWGTRAYMTESGPVKLTSNVNSSEWRINGPFVTR